MKLWAAFELNYYQAGKLLEIEDNTITNPIPVYKATDVQELARRVLPCVKTLDVYHAQHDVISDEIINLIAELESLAGEKDGKRPDK